MILLLLALGAFAADDPAVNYRGRSIDVKAYIEGFPFKNFHFSPEAGRAFFVRKGDEEHLFEAGFRHGKRLDVDSAKKLSDIDFSKRNLWGAQASPANGRLYVMGDEDNTEITNLYEYADGGFRRLTDEKYIYGWSLSPDGRKIAFSARSGAQEFTPGSVGVIDLETRTVTKLWHDSKALRATWGAVAWSRDQSKLVLPVVCDEDRTHKSLLLIPAAGGGAKPLLDCSVKRSVTPAWEWLDDGSFVFTSDETDNDVAHRLDVATDKTTRLTDPAWNLIDAQLIDGEQPRLLALQRKPISTVLHLIDPRDGSVLWQKEYPATVSMVDGTRQGLLVSFTSPVVPFEIHSVVLKGDRPKLTKVVDYDGRLKKKIVHCKAEKVSFATFDSYAAPGETQTLHAFLYSPVEPAKAAEARLLVESFYGGVNRYNAKIHMLCNAGFHVISPAPRGSWDWGREFHDKMQGDLGGGEILDVIEAAKAFSARLKIPARHVGAFGGSHGGYATLRALTLPDEVNGHRPGFRLGFGLSDYGITHLVRYVKSSNIPGWVTDMTREDPASNPEKWVDRSPQTHACRASGPLFLSHGTNDKRVSVDESRNFVQVLKGCPGRSGDVYYELEGQGHGYKGTTPILAYYKALFGFLDTIR